MELLKIKKTCCVIALWVLSVGIGYGQQVTLDEATQMASTFLSGSNIHMSGQPMQIVAVNDTLYPNLFFFNNIDGGWVIVSGDKRCQPILAYSDEGSLSMNDAPKAFYWLMESYNATIDSLSQCPSLAADLGWNESNSANNAPSRVVVAPLLQKDGEYISWDQHGNADYRPEPDKSYNKFCPHDSVLGGDSDRRAAVGCVAVALGQIMWYWEWPKAAIVKDDNGNNLIRVYDWEKMPTRLYNSTEVYSVDQVANLLHDAGVAANMNYGIGESTANDSDARNALRNVFAYIDSAALNTIDTDRKEIMKQDLDLSRPVYFSGVNPSTESGHAMVIDGYDIKDNFHVNFGWDGAFVGYYSLSSRALMYTEHQNAFYRLRPIQVDRHGIISGDVDFDSTFVYQHVGSVTIRDHVTIDSGKIGVVYSEKGILLDNEVSIERGSEVLFYVKNDD